MATISRVTTWTSGQILTAANLNSEYDNIINYLNNADAGTSTWTVVKATTLTPTTVNANVTFDSTSSHGILGSTTNDSAASGNVGEYVVSTVSAVSISNSGQYFDATSISLTAGDWDIRGEIIFYPNGATFTDLGVEAGVSTTSGNSSVGLTQALNVSYVYPIGQSTFTFWSVPIKNYRVSLTTTTTHYLKGHLQTFTAGTPKCYGSISARRVR